MAIPIKATLTLVNKGFNTALSASSKALGAFVGLAKMASVAVLGIATAFGFAVMRSTAFIDRLGKTSDKLGVGVEFLQRFRFAAEQSGVSVETADMALQRFTRRIGEAKKGTGELLPALKSLGITQSDIADSTPEEAFLLFADAIGKVDDSTAQLALAFKGFDSEGVALINLIKDGSDEFLKLSREADSLGFILSKTATKGVEDFNDNLNALFKLIGGVVNQVVAKLAPALKILTLQFTNFVKEIAAGEGGFEALAMTIRDSLLTGFNSFLSGLETVINFMGQLMNAIVEFGRMVPGTDLFPIDDEEIDKKIRRLRQSIGFFGAEFGSTLQGRIDLLKELGVNVDDFQKKIDNVGFFDKLITGMGDSAEVNDEVNAFIEQMIKDLNASTLPFPNKFDFSKLRATIAEQIGKGFSDGIEEGTGNPETEEDIISFFERLALRITGILETSLESLSDRLDKAGIGDFTKTLEDGLVKAATMFEDTLAEAFVNGKADFSDLADFIKITLAKAFIQKTITGPLMALFGLAEGGPAQAGRPYIVGEEGPELFVPNTSGTVVPNNEITSNGGSGVGGTNIVYNISAVDTQSFQQAIARDPEFIFAVTQAGRRRLPGA